MSTKKPDAIHRRCFNCLHQKYRFCFGLYTACFNPKSPNAGDILPIGHCCEKWEPKKQEAGK